MGDQPVFLRYPASITDRTGVYGTIPQLIVARRPPQRILSHWPNQKRRIVRKATDWLRLIANAKFLAGRAASYKLRMTDGIARIFGDVHGIRINRVAEIQEANRCLSRSRYIRLSRCFEDGISWLDRSFAMSLHDFVELICKLDAKRPVRVAKDDSSNG